MTEVARIGSGKRLRRVLVCCCCCCCCCCVKEGEGPAKAFAIMEALLLADRRTADVTATVENFIFLNRYVSFYEKCNGIEVYARRVLSLFSVVSPVRSYYLYCTIALVKYNSRKI